MDGGHVIYGLFGSKAAQVISRVAVITLILMGGMGLVNFAPPQGRLLFSAEFIVDAIFSNLLFLAGYLGICSLSSADFLKVLKTDTIG